MDEMTTFDVEVSTPEGHVVGNTQVRLIDLRDMDYDLYEAAKDWLRGEEFDERLLEAEVLLGGTDANRVVMLLMITLASQAVHEEISVQECVAKMFKAAHRYAAGRHQEGTLKYIAKELGMEGA